MSDMPLFEIGSPIHWLYDFGQVTLPLCFRFPYLYTGDSHSPPLSTARKDLMSLKLGQCLAHAVNMLAIPGIGLI